MPRWPHLSSFCAAFLVLVAVPLSVSYAAPPSDSLYPATTRGFVSVSNAEQLGEAWDRTRLGQLLNRPEMEEFTEDVNRQFKERVMRGREGLGLEWDDLRGVASGEVSLAVLQDAANQPAVAFTADVTGRLDRAQQLLAKIDRDLLQRGARKGQRQVQGTLVTLYELPLDEEDEREEPRTAVYFIEQDMLVASNSVPAAEDLLRRLKGAPGESLSRNPDYIAVLGRAHDPTATTQPQIRWFVDPLGLAETAQAARAEQRSGIDMLRAMRNAGFDSIRGAGGFLTVAPSPRYDLLHRTAIFAPRPWRGSMQMLAFPNVTNLHPQPWVPADVSSYISLQIDVMTAYDHFGPIFDETVGEGEPGVWQDVVQSLEDDPNGPGINLRRDLIAHLRNRATIITDYVEPISPTSERMLFAIEASDEATLAETVRKSMEPDPNVTKRTFQGHTIWEVREEEVALPEVELGDGLPPAVQDALPPVTEAEDAGEARLLSSSAVAVANGHLFIASDVDFLEHILNNEPNRPQLLQDADYQQVASELERIGAEEFSAWAFTRTEDAWHPTYELLRTNQLAESQTMMANVLNRILGTGPEGGPRERRFDGSKMPEYETVRPYLGPAGLYVVSEQEGWFITGFTLNNAPDSPAPAPALGDGATE